MSDDERLIATHTGGVLFDIDLNCAKWDEKTGEMIYVPKKNKIRFRISKKFKKFLNQ